MRAEFAAQAARARAPLPLGQWWRRSLSGLARLAVSLGAGLLAGAVLIALLGTNPLAAIRVLLETVLATRSGFTDTLLTASTLLIIALGYGPAFHARVWSVGAEGQLHLSAMAVAAVVFTLPRDLSPIVALPVAIAAGVVAGMAWALIPAWLRAYRDVNEVVSTLMLSFVGIILMQWLVRTTFPDPFSGALQTPVFPPAYRLPMIAGTRLHVGVMMALALVPAMYYLLYYTALGYRVRAVGANPWASRASGINVHRTIIVAFLIGGALAGLAGAFHVLGLTHRLMADLSPGYGFTGIMVALLARNNPLAAVAAALFFSGLSVGSEGVQVEFGIKSDFILVLMGILVFFVLAGEALWERRRGS